ncbi:hypothetical protein P43SY_001497 [Pythium insidiosum]|uniref:FYVE-type domain-containing protein n=1 Tax=Pythium insidiosum TaxID=114742 RepID=A0AAD5LUQ1_PYTIN|nr:hypothetical protein P43SY_001497 [Pythium insidiosum]
MNLAAPMQHTIHGTTVTQQPDPFDDSPLNPLNMSRTTSAAQERRPPSAKLLARARTAAADLAELASTSTGWRFLSEKNETTLYELRRSSDVYIVKGVTTVHVDVARVLSLLAARTTVELRLRLTQLFGKQLVDAVTIDHMSCSTPPPPQPQQEPSYTEDDTYSVDWFVLKSAEGKRDFTVAAYQDVFTRDVEGRLVRLGRTAAAVPSSQRDRVVGVHSMLSLDFKDVPPLPTHKKTERMHFVSSGLVVEETHERGVLRLSLFLSLMPTVSTRKHSKRYEKWLQQLAWCVGNVALQAKTLEASMADDTLSCSSGSVRSLGLGVLDKKTFEKEQKAAWKKSSHCRLCVKAFHAFRRCHHCRFCGEAVCGKCSGFIDISRFEVVQTVSGVVRPAATPSMRSQYTETRGCAHCIQNLLHNESLVAEQRRSSLASSRGSSGRNSKLSVSALTQQYDDEDQISLDDSSVSDRPSAPKDHVPVRVAPSRERSEGSSRDGDSDTFDRTPALTMSMLKPTHANAKLSLSTVSTSYSSTSNPLLDDRVSSGSQTARYPPRTTQQLRGAEALSPDMGLISFQSEYANDPDILALAGLSLAPTPEHECSPDVPDSPPRFAQSVFASRSAAMSRPEPEFEPELEPEVFGDGSTAASLVNAVKARQRAARLMAASAGPRLTSQTPSQPSSRPMPRTPTAPSSQMIHSGAMPPLPRRPSAPSRSSAARTSWRSAGTDSTFGMLSLPSPSQSQAPSQSQRSLSTDSFSSAASSSRNDMILLAAPEPSSPKFVLFADAHRESIFVRPGDGSDMIPLDLSSRC